MVAVRFTGEKHVDTRRVNDGHLFRLGNQLQPISRGNGDRNKQINLYDPRLLHRKTFTFRGPYPSMAIFQHSDSKLRELSL